MERLQKKSPTKRGGLSSVNFHVNELLTKDHPSVITTFAGT